MVNAVYLVITLIWFVPLEFVNCQNYMGTHSGDFCTLPSTGAVGQCQFLQACSSAQRELQAGVYPRTCGFQGNQPIVCCAEVASATSQPVKTTPTTIYTTRSTTTYTTRPYTTYTTGPYYSIYTTKPSTAKPINQEKLQVGVKSRQKCREYSKHAFQDTASPIVGSEHILPQCTINDPALLQGILSKPKEFPHMALIGFDDGSKGKLWQCGGTLVSERFVLTAANCLYSREYGAPRYVRLGELILNDNTDDAKPQEFVIEETIRHPNYKPPSLYNDIALLKLKEDVNLSPYIRPACLNPNENLNLNRAIASGWSQAYPLSSSDHLLKVEMKYVTNADCNFTYRNNIGMRLQSGIVKTQLCMDFHDKTEDACQDTGGPLQIPNTEEDCMYTIIGVASLSRGCGLVNVPTVFTRISSYVGWIEDIVWS